MSPRLSTLAETMSPTSVRPYRRLGSPPALRLLTSTTPADGPPLRRLQASRRRAPLLPLLPVAYRGSYLRRLLAPRRPVEHALLSVIQQTYLAGASTRTVDALAETVGVPGTDPATVEAEAREWDRRVEGFRNRRLPDGYAYLQLADISALVREDDEVQPCQVIVAVAIAESGNRDVVAVAIRPAESHASFWEAFLGDLNERGLRDLRLVTSDRFEGLLPALARVFPGARWQRCRERFIAEALAKVPRDGRPAVEASLRAVFVEPDTASALRRLAEVRAQFEFAYPEFVAAVSGPVGSVLTSYQVPAAQRRLVCSVKGLASLQRELRQSCQLVGIFPHREALLRLTGVTLQEISEEWAARPRRRARAAAGAWARSAWVAASAA